MSPVLAAFAAPARPAPKENPRWQNQRGFVVDLEGFEPLTSRMRTERSTMNTVNMPHKKEEFWEK